jgi:diguanylate cyclase
MQKILVIEDEKPIRENIIEMLELEKFQVIGAGNGKIGLELAIHHQPDLILCDVMMPEMDGYTVLTELRENSQTSTIPFIFLTARAEKSDFRKGMELGADDYITKPCTPDELIKAVQMRLKKHQKLTQNYKNIIDQALEQINFLLYYDTITNLPNRLLLSEKFTEIVGFKPAFVPVLCLSIDRFTRIKETIDHGELSLLIKSLAQRLKDCLKSHDLLSRFSDEQFVIILANIQNKAEVDHIIQKIINTINKGFILDVENNYKELFVTVSVGVSFYRPDGDNVEKLVKNAQQAMRKCLETGGNKYQFYIEEFTQENEDKLIIEAELYHALERKQLFLNYQPQVDLKTGKIVGAEVLLRWQHPQLGFISPGKFIPIAEETGLIIQIGEWLIRTASQQIKNWEKAGFSALRVAVNISATQFNQSSFRQRLIEILLSTGINPQNLDLELTESILVQNKESAIKQLKSFKELGLKVAIDDFGTGYSSLSYLQQFPFDILKIDQVFVRNITKDEKSVGITKAIIEMAHSLNLKVIAEGIETEEELAFLQGHNCDEMQGYLFSKPLTAKDFEQLLISGKCLNAGKIG